MTTLPELPDGMSWRSRGLFIYADKSGLEMWIKADGLAGGSLRDRPDAAHLEALLRKANGWELPSGLEWRHDLGDGDGWHVSNEAGAGLWRLSGTGDLVGSLASTPAAPMLAELILLRNSELASPRKAEPRGCPTPGACSCESLRAERDEAVREWANAKADANRLEDENARLRERIDELTEEVAALRRRDRAGSWWRAAIKIVNTLRGGR